jgi:hypothetical protein
MVVPLRVTVTRPFRSVRCTETLSIRGPWYGEAESGPFTFLGLRPDLSVEVLYDLLDDGQADSGTGEAILGVEFLEHLEDPLLVLHAETYAVVLDREYPFAMSRGRSYMDQGRFRPVELDGVADKFCSTWDIYDLSAMTDGSGSMETLPPLSFLSE